MIGARHGIDARDGKEEVFQCLAIYIGRECISRTPAILLVLVNFVPEDHLGSLVRSSEADLGLNLWGAW